MPSTFWERDAAYRRRIGIIVPIVVTAYIVLFLAADRIRYEDIPRFIGWRGELEVLPEITVVPELASIETEPAPREETPRETVALDLSSKGDVRSDPAPKPPVTEAKPRIVEPAEGKAEIRSMDRPGDRETSYTDHFALIKTVEPVYPAFERSEGIEGTVTVEMLVDENGMVIEANALSIMGPESFADSALDAVRQFVFEPPTENGRPTTIWVRLRVKFRITG
jgi:TonB family protein